MDHPQPLYSIHEPLLKENSTKKKNKKKKNKTKQKNRNLVSTNFFRIGRKILRVGLRKKR